MKNTELRLTGIETRLVYDDVGYEYRFFSYVNGMRGAWYEAKNCAEDEAAHHEELMRRIHPGIEEDQTGGRPMTNTRGCDSPAIQETDQ